MLIDGTVAREALVQLFFEDQPDSEPQPKRQKSAPTIDLAEIRFPIQISTISSDLFDNCAPTVIDRNLRTTWSIESLTIDNDQFKKARMTINVDSRNLPVADNEILVSNNDSNVFVALAQACELQHVKTPVSIHIEGKHVEARIVVRVEVDRSSKALFAVFNILYPSKITVPSSTSVEDFLRHIQPQTSDQFLGAYQSKALIPKLAPFQSQNVEWMMAREGHRVVNGNVECIEQTDDVSPFLWEKVVLNSGQTVHVNRITRDLIADPSVPDFVQAQALTHRGGLLADEMGLGKTVCAIALILMHKLNPNDRTHPKDVDGLVTSGATLIITPSAIIRQWEAEFERHAPTLRVKTYRGVKASVRDNEPVTSADLAQYDVVLTDYNVLQEEIYHARAIPDRPRRHAAKYPFKRSPLVEILWLRVMLDEAQMVESTMNLVAEMARLIPRWYSWGVTGTPLKSSFDDLFGLLLFLGFTPSMRRSNAYKQLYAQDAPSWTKGLFWDFSKTIMRRNVKAALTSQIHIPPQHRNIVKISFSAIEQHYYQSLWEQCARSTNLPQLDAINWTPTDNFETSPAEIQRTFAKLRTWLLSLRQACVHPTVGGTNKKRVISQAVRTLAEVLDALLRQAKDDIDNTSANIINSRLRRAGMAEIEKQWQAALDIYLSAVPQTLEMIDTVNKRIQDAKAQQSEEETDDERHKKSTDPMQEYVTNLHNRYHKWLAYLHRSYFFIAGMYHELAKEEEEREYYDKAADTRRQILSRAQERVTASKREIPRIAVPMKGKIGPSREQETLVLSFDRLDRINTLCEILDSQLLHINKWRATLSELLCSGLVDHNEEQQDTTGDEYEASLITQEKLDLYQDAYQAMLRDRNFWVNGIWATGLQQTDLFKDLSHTSESEEISALQVELSDIRKAHMPETQTQATLRTIIAELRDIMKRPLINAVEKHIIRTEYDRLNAAATKQRDLQERLEIEYRRFTQLYNHRIEYYRALQELSDHVMAWESRNPTLEARQLLRDEESYEKALKEQSARCRYLENLLKEKDEKERKCLICQSGFSKGLMTYCGHMFCQECATIWLRLHHRCPQCNTPVKLEECYAIAWNKLVDSEIPESSSSPKDQEIIDVDQEISAELLEQINRCEIEEGLGAKLDSIIRHIKYIIATSNGKSVIFSQWKDVLNLIANGLDKNGIKFVRVDKTVRDDRIKLFREDPDINVILLHARSQSSGLTLICAQTVFIVEPVLNEALERQAISRVHRIGQTKETNVYWYIVQETIEERIHAIYSVRHRRKINMERRDDLIDDSTVPLATQSEGGGERVSDEDLKLCFTSNEYSALNM